MDHLAFVDCSSWVAGGDWGSAIHLNQVCRRGTCCRAVTPGMLPARTAAASESSGVAPPGGAATGQPGDRSRPPDPATATSANDGSPEVGVTPNRVDNESAATVTAATRSAHPDPAEVGICTSTPAVTAYCRKTVRTASSRPAARRSHPRNVDAGTDNTAPIRR
jgi:hypothetical protein